MTDAPLDAPLIVLDTNVLVSAAVFPGGAPEEVWRRVLRGRVRAVTSVPLLHELGRVLGARFGWERGPTERLLRQVARNATVVIPVAVVGVAPDPDDDVVLGTALAGGATHVVTGDRSLRGVAAVDAIRVVTARELLEQVGS